MISKQCRIACLLLVTALAACGSETITFNDAAVDSRRPVLDSQAPRLDRGLLTDLGLSQDGRTDATGDGMAADGQPGEGAVDDGAATDAQQDVSAQQDSSVADAAPDAELCPTQPCDLLEQCGCGSEACDTTFQADGLTVCRPITAQGTEIAPCSASTECAAGYLCLGGGRWSRCKRFCGKEADCHGGGRSRCFSVYSAGSPVANTHYCTANCDPLAANPAGCPAGWQCFALYSSDTGQAYSECAGPGPMGVGGACDDAADCAKDLTCVFFHGTGQCLAECRKTAPASACPSGKTCFSYNPQVSLGGIEYGYCN